MKTPATGTPVRNTELTKAYHRRVAVDGLSLRAGR